MPLSTSGRERGGAGENRMIRRHGGIAAIVGAAAWGLVPSDAAAEMDYVGQWGGYGTGPTQFSYPTGLALGPGGDLYVADGGNNRVSRFTPDGQLVDSFGGFGGAPGQFRGPDHLSFSPVNGDLYVADKSNHRIQRFTPDGDFVLEWGSLGTGPGQFDIPWGVHVDASGDVWVTSRDQQRLQKFTESGTFLGEWGVDGTGPGQFRKPHGILTDEQGNMYVGDVVRHDVQKFDSSVQYQLQWGGPGSEPGQFLHPHVSLFAHGGIVVADWLEHPHGGRLTEFTTSGALREVLVDGPQGTGPMQFHTVCGVVHDDAGRWYLLEWGNHRISVLEEAPVAVGPVAASGAVAPLRILPNPSRGPVRVSFQVHRPGPVRVDVFDVAGRLVEVLFEGVTGPDARTVGWDGSDARGRRVPSGVYLVRVSGSDGDLLQRMTVVR